MREEKSVCLHHVGVATEVLVCCGFQIVVAVGKVNCSEVKLLAVCVPLPEHLQDLRTLIGFKNAVCWLAAFRMQKQVSDLIHFF
jgi:hypothetical protein